MPICNNKRYKTQSGGKKIGQVTDFFVFSLDRIYQYPIWYNAKEMKRVKEKIRQVTDKWEALLPPSAHCF